MEFKIGDRVKIIKALDYLPVKSKDQIGEIGVVTNFIYPIITVEFVQPSPMACEKPSEYWFFPYDTDIFELVQDKGTQNCQQITTQEISCPRCKESEFISVYSDWAQTNVKKCKNCNYCL